MLDNNVTIINIKPILKYFREVYNSDYLEQFKEV